MIDEDYGDITDPIDGRDVKVICTKAPGRMWASTEVRPRGKASKLANSSKEVSTMMESIPSLDELFTLKSYEELEKIVNDWLNGDSEESTSEGTFRGGNTSSSSTTTAGSSNETTKYKSLDDAFADLEDL